jgi:ubiquinone/menaquinone biosynthesis C-methylase UbiE
VEQQVSAVDRKFWSGTTHESRVENFYGWGVEKYGDFHNGYLNFGFWEDGMTNYLEAAENMVRSIATLGELNNESIVLDVGCGMGTQDIYMFRKFSPKSIDAVDVTWKHVQHSRRRAQEAKCEDRVRFHHGTATELPFPDNHFTTAMSIEAPEHFNTREKFMKEAYRVLKPGGTIALADYTLKRPPRNLIEKFVIESARWLWKVPADNADSAEQYEVKLKRTGFKNIKIREVGALTIPGYYIEATRPETVRELVKIRGFVAGRLGGIIDIAVHKAYQMGLLEYIFVQAKK